MKEFRKLSPIPFSHTGKFIWGDHPDERRRGVPGFHIGPFPVQGLGAAGDFQHTPGLFFQLAPQNLARTVGFEPTFHSLEDCCLLQSSHVRITWRPELESNQPLWFCRPPPYRLATRSNFNLDVITVPFTSLLMG